MELKRETFDQMRSTLTYLERRLSKLQKSGVCPGESELLSTRELNRLLDECLEQFEREMIASFEEHQHEGMNCYGNGTADIDPGLGDNQRFGK